LHTILIGFGIPMKMVRLIQVCLNVQHSPGRQEFVLHVSY